MLVAEGGQLQEKTMQTGNFSWVLFESGILQEDMIQSGNFGNF